MSNAKPVYIGLYEETGVMPIRSTRTDRDIHQEDLSMDGQRVCHATARTDRECEARRQDTQGSAKPGPGALQIADTSRLQPCRGYGKCEGAMHRVTRAEMECAERLKASLDKADAACRQIIEDADRDMEALSQIGGSTMFIALIAVKNIMSDVSAKMQEAYDVRDRAVAMIEAGCNE